MPKRADRMGLAMLFVLLAACSRVPAAPTATPAPLRPTIPVAPVATVAPAATAPFTLTPFPGPSVSQLNNVPRNRTLKLVWAIGSPIGVTNPWNTLGYTHQEGNNLLWEGLAYYAIFADKEIPWLAQSMTYTKPDFTELTIKLNPQARWSDGQPVTAQDVLFTCEGFLNNDQLPYHATFQEFVQAIKAVDDQTVVLTFKLPAPRFKFEVLTLKFDTGIPILPAHVLSQQADVNAFAGGLDMPHSGPYNLVAWDANGKVFDLRPDWWAVKAGLIQMPAVERVLMVSDVVESPDKVAERLDNNEFDTSGDMNSAVIAGVVKQNPAVTTYSGSAPPYGNLDWWPNSLWMNTLLAPYSDVRVRRALNRAIDRRTIDQIVYPGAPNTTIYPFPLYPGLQRFADSPAVKALEAKYQPGKFDPAESAQLMTEAGFTKNANGLWTDAQGNTLNATLYASNQINGDIAVILAEMLKAAGFDAVVEFRPIGYENGIGGKPGLYLIGHGASLTDPYATFESYHSRYSPPIGTSSDFSHLSRYNNPDYDKIIDAMAVLPADDPQFQAVAAQAMEIYWRDVIDIPIVQWLHRIPYNQTFWTNWPTRDNPALGPNGAFWAHTGMLVITALKPAQ